MRIIMTKCASNHYKTFKLGIIMRAAVLSPSKHHHRVPSSPIQQHSVAIQPPSPLAPLQSASPHSLSHSPRTTHRRTPSTFAHDARVVVVDDDTASPPGSEDPQSPRPAPRVPGWAWLTLVAILWGSYAPALRLIYALPDPPSPASLLFVRTVVCAAALLIVDALRGPSPPTRRGVTTTPKDGNVLNATLPLMWMGGVELGVLKFAGEATQALGLQHTTAIRGAFLIQATSLITPMIATAAGMPLSRRILAAAVVAAAGAVLMTARNVDAADASASLNTGDPLILLAACFYSLSTFRLGKYAVRFPDEFVRFAAWKTLAGVTVAACWVLSEGPRSLAHGWGDPVAWGGTLWLALGPGALATYAQLAGQRAVGASEAQVVYSSTPLWSALLSVVLLEEGGLTSGWEYVGGLLIVLAGVAAAVQPKRVA